MLCALIKQLQCSEASYCLEKWPTVTFYDCRFYASCHFFKVKFRQFFSCYFNFFPLPVVQEVLMFIEQVTWSVHVLAPRPQHLTHEPRGSSVSTFRNICHFDLLTLNFFLFKFFILCVELLCLLVCLCTTCLLCLWRTDIRLPGTRVTGSCEPLYGCWELNLGSLKEQSLLITEPFQQLPCVFSPTIVAICCMLKVPTDVLFISVNNKCIILNNLT